MLKLDLRHFLQEDVVSMVIDQTVEFQVVFVGIEGIGYGVLIVRCKL